MSLRVRRVLYDELPRQGKRQGGRIVMICERMATGKIPLPAKKAGWKIFWGIEEVPPIH